MGANRETRQEQQFETVRLLRAGRVTGARTRARRERAHALGSALRRPPRHHARTLLNQPLAPHPSQTPPTTQNTLAACVLAVAAGAFILWRLMSRRRVMLLDFSVYKAPDRWVCLCVGQGVLWSAQSRECGAWSVQQLRSVKLIR